ncbi:MAG: anti-sigma factor, partial [Verrucomicrobium sp.]|nr:anti-sigma factor [Verrucomicrobium sp.]
RILQSEKKVDARLREAIAEFEDAAAGMALLLPEEAPPPDLKARLMAEVRTRRRSNVVSGVFFKLLRSPLVAWAAAAVLAVGAFKLWEDKQKVVAQIPALAASEEQAKAETTLAQQAQKELEQKLAAATTNSATLTAEVTRLKQANAVSSMEVATLRSSLKRYEEGVAVVVWDGNAQQGQLKLEKMPPVQPNKDYQLWVIDKGKAKPVDAGVVKVNDRGHASFTFKPVEPIRDVSKFALSVEKEGGVVAGEGPIIMVGP